MQRQPASFEGVCVTTVILAPGACGGGLRAAPLATTSPSPAAPAAPLTSSKNGQNATIRVTSELARSEDPFVRCRVMALPCMREHRKINFHQKNTYDLEDFLFVCLPHGAQRLIFKVNYHLREDHFFSILTQNWPNSTSGPRGASGIQCGRSLIQSGSNLIPIG